MPLLLWLLRLRLRLLLTTLYIIQTGRLQLLNYICCDLREDLGRQIGRPISIAERRVNCVVDSPGMRMRLLVPCVTIVTSTVAHLRTLARWRRSVWGHHLGLLVPRVTFAATVVHLRALTRRRRSIRGHHLRLRHVDSIGPILRGIRGRLVGRGVSIGVVIHPVYMAVVIVWAAVVRIVIVWHEGSFSWAGKVKEECVYARQWLFFFGRISNGRY